MTNSSPINPSDIQKFVILLRDGVITDAHGLLPWGSNFTYLMRLSIDGHDEKAIYKPRHGERPLWDFPDGSLCRRELAAFEVSEALGWHIVPPTVLRDGPHGLGMVQSYIDHDPNQHYFTFGDGFKAQLRRIALFDHLINNADRKGGHCLLDGAGRIWAIDHGISFHAQPKLRTVIWEFAGEEISSELLLDLKRFVENMNSWLETSVVRQLLDESETEALHERVAALMLRSHYPEPGSNRQYPWPPI